MDKKLTLKDILTTLKELEGLKMYNGEEMYYGELMIHTPTMSINTDVKYGFSPNVDPSEHAYADFRHVGSWLYSYRTGLFAHCDGYDFNSAMNSLSYNTIDWYKSITDKKLKRLTSEETEIEKEKLMNESVAVYSNKDHFIGEIYDIKHVVGYKNFDLHVYVK